MWNILISFLLSLSNQRSKKVFYNRFTNSLTICPTLRLICQKYMICKLRGDVAEIWTYFCLTLRHVLFIFYSFYLPWKYCWFMLQGNADMAFFYTVDSDMSWFKTRKQSYKSNVSILR